MCKKITVCLTLLIAAFAPAAVRADDGCEADPKLPTIRAYGEAVVTAPADMVVVAVAVENSGLDYALTVSRTQRMTNDLIAGLDEMGISKSELQIDNFTARSEYDWSDSGNRARSRRARFTGYVATSNFRVTLRDLARYPDMMRFLLKDPAVEIQWIDFRNHEHRKFQDQARESALKAAQEKAVLMSAALGKTTGNPLKIGEEAGGDDRGNRMFLAKARASNVSLLSRDSDGPEGGIESAIQYRAQLCVVFELK